MIKVSVHSITQKKNSFAAELKFYLVLCVKNLAAKTFIVHKKFFFTPHKPPHQAREVAASRSLLFKSSLIFFLYVHISLKRLSFSMESGAELLGGVDPTTCFQ